MSCDLEVTNESARYWEEISSCISNYITPLVTRDKAACSWGTSFLHQADCQWLMPCPVWRHSGAMRSFPWSHVFALPLTFSSKVCLLVFPKVERSPINPAYGSARPTGKFSPVLQLESQIKGILKLTNCCSSSYHSLFVCNTYCCCIKRAFGIWFKTED